MANPEHVARLKEGVDAWNRWLHENPEIRPDLTDANLIDANLRDVNLNQANLTWANLTGANLDGAWLLEANFSWAELAKANLAGARLASTVLGNTDLTGAKGLETCEHLASSIIDYQTLAKSWPLPLKCLRGGGLPEALIEYLPLLHNQAIQFYSCFISYSARDQEFANQLH